MGPGDDLAERGASVVRAASTARPEIAIILGSGLGPAVDGMDIEAEIAFDDLPGFPEPTVPGHAGRLRIGRLAGAPVAVFLGRIHHYEGHPMPLVTLPARLAAAIGLRTLVVTASVGGLDPAVEPGTLVVGKDHLSFLGESPLRGWRDAAGTPAFVDLTDAYPRDLAELALEALRAEGMPPVRAVYASMPGPAYETPAEIEFLRRSGATVVGMSVVPEVTAAAALGLRCLGIYCVTNAVGKGVSHTEVQEVAATSAGRLGAVLERLAPRLNGKEHR